MKRTHIYLIVCTIFAVGCASTSGTFEAEQQRLQRENDQLRQEKVHLETTVRQTHQQRITQLEQEIAQARQDLAYREDQLRSIQDSLSARPVEPTADQRNELDTRKAAIAQLRNEIRQLEDELTQVLGASNVRDPL